MRHSLTLLVAISISFSTSVAHPRHDDRSHKHKHAPRQGAFAGIQMVSNPGGLNPTELPSSDGIVAASVITSHPISTPTTDLSGSPADQLDANATTRTFPITVLQIPVATICPPNTSIPLPIFSYPLKNTTNSLNRTYPGGPILNTTIPLTNATGYVPISTQASSPSPTATLADPNARIILDSNGCQTLFSPVTTAICSTVVSIGGQVPVSVTECGQWMTFSSSPVCGAAAAATALPNGTAGETMAFFLAPWYDVAAGVVPARVQVQTCSNFATGGGGGSSSCVTRSESWSVSTTTALSTVVQTARFFGGAVGPLNLTLIPNHLTTSIPSTNGTTTSLCIDTTLTHLSPHAVPTIVRSRLDPDQDQDTSASTTSTSGIENTIMTTVQLHAITQTYQLESAVPPQQQEEEQQQEQQHTTVTTTVTVTVQMTLTSLVPPLPLSTLEA